MSESPQTTIEAPEEIAALNHELAKRGVEVSWGESLYGDYLFCLARKQIRLLRIICRKYGFGVSAYLPGSGTPQSNKTKEYILTRIREAS